jgi:hypothetical protein
MRLAERGIGFAAISHQLTSGAWMDENSRRRASVIRPTSRTARASVAAQEHQGQGGRPDPPVRVRPLVGRHHLSALLALDPRYLKAQDLPITAIRGAIPFGGYELTKYHAHLAEEHERGALADAHLEYIFGKPGTRSRVADHVREGRPRSRCS